jgi:O-antigen ligase
MIATPVRLPITVIDMAETPAFRVARVLLVGTLLAAPLAFGAVQTWAWASLCVLVSGALICWAAGSVRDKAIRILWTPLYVPALAFLGVVVLQVITRHTVDPIATREALLKGTTYVVIFFLSVNLFADAAWRSWRVLGWTITVYTYAFAVFAIVQFFSSPDKIFWTVKPRWGGYVFGSYVSHNHYAGLMEMLIPVVVAFLLSTSNRGSQRYLVGFGLLVALSSMVLCGSRGGATALLVEAALLVLAMGRLRPSREKLIGAVAFVVLVFGMAVWLVPANVSQRFSATIQSPDIAYGIRRNMTVDSLRMFRDHALLGVGLGGFEAVYPRYQSFASDFLIDYAHNDYVQFLAETGVAGGAILLVAIVVFGDRFVRQCRAGLITERSFIRLGAFLACIGLLAHSWVDFNLHIPANAALFAFLLGITQTSPESQTGRFA